MSDSASESFDFFIAQKSDIAIVSLVGPVGRENSIKLEECYTKVLELEVKYIVFNLRDISDVKDAFFRPFAQMVAASRKKGNVRISGLHPRYKEVLGNLGLLRQHELSNNLNEAIQSLFPHKKIAA